MLLGLVVLLHQFFLLFEILDILLVFCVTYIDSSVIGLKLQMGPFGLPGFCIAAITPCTSYSHLPNCKGGGGGGG